MAFSSISSNTVVAEVQVVGTTLTITEVEAGSTTITVTASDEKGANATSSFELVISETVSPCAVDNTIDFTLRECTENPDNDSLTPVYTESVNGDIRTINANTVPNHIYGAPRDKIFAVDATYNIDVTPTKSEQTTNLLGMTRIDFQFGVALNGVKLDPAAAFPYENTSTGELNFDWVLEATTNASTTSLDCNQAHLQANGAYHYHGDFVEYANVLGIDGTAMVQVGWAADGFPVYYKYAYSTADNAGSSLAEMKSSYKELTGERPGDGVSAPCGAYNGKYEQDFKYMATLGDLDECNGRTGVTPEFPEGTYYYMITTDYPIIPRCFWGTPDNSFRVGVS